MLEKWRNIIPVPKDKINENTRVCELHFEPHFIEREYEELKMPDGTIIQSEIRGKARLRPDAVPSIFKTSEDSTVPKYLNRKVPKARTDPSTRNKNVQTSPKKRRATSKDPPSSPKKGRTNVSDRTDEVLETNGSVPEETVNENVLNTQEPYTPNSDNSADTFFKKPDQVKLPAATWTYLQDENNLVFFHLATDNTHQATMNTSYVLTKQIVFPKHIAEFKPLVFISGRKTDKTREIKEKSDLEDFLKYVDSLHICPGTGLEVAEDPRSFHCPGYCPQTAKGKIGKRCKACVQKRHAMKKAERRHNKSKKTRKIKTRKLQRQKRTLTKKVRNNIY